MRIRCLPVILLLLIAVSPLLAQSDAPASREDVLKLFEVMKIHDQMVAVMESVAKQQRSMIHESMRARFPTITEEELARLEQLTADAIKDVPVDGMLNDMVPVYQKHLSKADVDAMSVFYSSPTGQKLLREMPAMTAEAMQASAPRIQAMMDKVMERAEQMEREDRKEHGASPKAPANKN